MGEYAPIKTQASELNLFRKVALILFSRENSFRPLKYILLATVSLQSNNSTVNHIGPPARKNSKNLKKYAEALSKLGCKVSEANAVHTSRGTTKLRRCRHVSLFLWMDTSSKGVALHFASNEQNQTKQYPLVTKSVSQIPKTNSPQLWEETI